MEIAIYILVFFVGGCIGSAVVCMLYRGLIGESWLKGRSHCENCGRVLKWYELIPIISCLALRGRCRTCHAYFGYGHAAKEALVGICSVLCLATRRGEFPSALVSFWVSLIISCAIMSHIERRAKF